MSLPNSQIIIQISRRCVEIGIPETNTDDCGVPDVALGELACGDKMLVVVRGPAICDYCGKLKIVALMVSTTSRPLEELFQ